MSRYATPREWNGTAKDFTVTRILDGHIKQGRHQFSQKDPEGGVGEDDLSNPHDIWDDDI